MPRKLPAQTFHLRRALGSSAFALGLLLTACANGSAPGERPAVVAVDSLQTDPVVLTGAAVLAREGFPGLKGLRVGLVANHTALVDGTHLIDLLAGADGVDLVALFGPEHGLRGTAEAGASVEGGRDAKTGVPVYSLYDGRPQKPTPAMLEGVDVLLFDIQDVGARFYTYITTLGLVMQAAAAEGLPLVVLDRPNPLGGVYVSGFVLEPPHASVVGFYPIPIAHGLTMGELAGMIRGEGMLDGIQSLDLKVVQMEGWHREMRWPETGIPWVAPSPNLPTFETALVYAGTCLFEALNTNEGRGTLAPFQQVGAPYVRGREMAATLDSLQLPGAEFEGIRFTPQSIEGMATSPRFRGEAVEGVRIVIDDYNRYRPVETAVFLIDAFRRHAERAGAELVSRPAWLTSLAGTERLGTMLQNGTAPSTIIERWGSSVTAFESSRRPYLLYR